jgi:hypothetical protein
MTRVLALLRKVKENLICLLPCVWELVHPGGDPDLQYLVDTINTGV